MGKVSFPINFHEDSYPFKPTEVSSIQIVKGWVSLSELVWFFQTKRFFSHEMLAGHASPWKASTATNLRDMNVLKMSSKCKALMKNIMVKIYWRVRTSARASVQLFPYKLIEDISILTKICHSARIVRECVHAKIFY